MDELVLCFPRTLLDSIRHDSQTFYDEALWSHITSSLEPIPRSLAETDYTRKQLIVYVIVRVNDLILSYQRTPKDSEERLRAKYSIGFGGHVNATDLSLFSSTDDYRQLLRQAVWREVGEEITINSGVIGEPELICFINDDSNDVGRVHFGVVWLIRLRAPSVNLRGERGIGTLLFRNIRELEGLGNSLESWSRLMISYLSS